MRPTHTIIRAALPLTILAFGALEIADAQQRRPTPPRGRQAVAAVPPLNRTAPRSVEELRRDLDSMLARRTPGS